ncbi:Leucine-rich repeat (LRR) protein [Pedobacter terrae]|uniref:Leucine-rich repeat (LRR) protein n=1 Tax=Pedobacter terrae TaxID=405671 RepID=A0A1G7NV46_9SPHI|nr:leucine-rich repeat domain-containing protein [Pedobacter terrae]SDF77777.1 Leucine-rich repeat (LRR) protein [Pedobacter terrae]
MKLKFQQLVFVIFLVILQSCSKEEQVMVLQDKYVPEVRPSEVALEDFSVSLNARVLQSGERGEWKVISGLVVANFVVIEQKNSPFSKFKGIPGEQYVLEWKHWAKDGTESVLQTKVKIPEPAIEIKDETSSKFQTIRTLSVNPKYRGTWSFEGSYGYLISRSFDGLAEPANKKPSIEIHAFANTHYTATYTYIYAGKTFKYQTGFKTGNYTQDEGLFELQLSRGDGRVIEDNQGNVLELYLQASGIAWIFEQPNVYPALTSFTKLRKLTLGGSSLAEIPKIFGEYYRDLEDLSMDGMGQSTVFPENFGNLAKLKTLIFSPRNTASPYNEIILPKSFANLKALETFSVLHAGYVNFNGTLGSLSSLKTLKTIINALTEDIGELKALQHVELVCRSSAFPQRLAECTALTFLRLNFDDSASGDVVLASRIGNLKKLETFEITSNKLRSLPDSFAGLTVLKTLSINGTGLQSLPENFGNLPNLERLTLHGSFTKLPNSFGNLSKLNNLMLGGKAESLPESFGNLLQLSYFNAQSSSLKTLPNSIGNLKNLKEIDLSYSKLETLPETFAELDGLKTLNLAVTQLKTFPKAIIPLTAITEINLNSTNVGLIPDDIVHMKFGVILRLSGIPNLTLDHLKYVISIAKGKIFYTSFGYFVS